MAASAAIGQLISLHLQQLSCHILNVR